MKLKKKEDQSVDAPVLLRTVNKVLTGENTVLSEVTQSQKNTHGIHSLISG